MYRVNEVFYSLQGEGGRAGHASVFVRFSGCNLQCRVEPGEKSPGGFDCDTEFASGRSLGLDDLLGWIRDEAGPCRWVVLTGGEPGLQVDVPLIEGLHAAGFQIAVETNGTVLLPEGIDWITVSPKVAEHAVKQLTATEVKYVRAYGQGIPRPACRADRQYISPAFKGGTLPGRDLAWCIQLVKENPGWTLSCQQHKSWNVR